MSKPSPIVPWIGGKRRMAKHLLPMFPDHTCYVEPFAGGAALFFLKAPSPVEVINDINGDLVNLYRVVKHHLDELLRQFEWMLISREIYIQERDSTTSQLTDIQRAARFLYLQKMAFGGKVTGQNFGTASTTPPRFNRLRLEQDLAAASSRLARTYIEHLSWEEVIRRYDRPHTLFYLDPPYWGTEGYGVDFGLEQYDRMAELARTIQGKMIISVNDIAEMRKAFSGLEMHQVGIRYTVGGAEKSRTETSELIIHNW